MSVVVRAFLYRAEYIFRLPERNSSKILFWNSDSIWQQEQTRETTVLSALLCHGPQPVGGIGRPGWSAET